jgi:protocatechuate 3,4-dioxygenase beta subunit
LRNLLRLEKEGSVLSIRVTGEDYELLFYGAKVVETYSAGGVVTDEDGAPVPGVVITAALEGGAPIGYATTNSSGAWSFSGLAGKVIFTPAKGDYGFNPGSQETEGPRDNVDFIAIAPAPVPYTVSGWVQEIDGAGLDDILITFSQDGQAVATTFSLEGAFEKSGLLGEYYVSAQKEGWLFYPESIRVTGEDNDLLFYGAPITETYRVSGRITDEDGMPVTAVVVIADFGDGVQIATTTNSNGEWYFDNLSASVTVIPRKDGYTFDPLNQVVEASRDNVDFAAKKDEPEPTRYRVEGQVLDHNGDAVTNVLIVFKQGGETVATTYAIEGFFEKTGLVGEYYISAQKDGWVFEPASIRVTGVDRGLVFYGVEISQSYGASGRITDENSIPVSAVLVTAELENGSTRSTTTDANGRWAFANLAGEVTITPSKTGYSFTPDYQIIDDETVNADFLAIPDTFGVSGRVEDEQGNPIPMASIRALVGSDQIAATASDSTGAFSLDGFEGTVVIQVQKDGFDFEQDSYTVSGPSILTFTGSRQVETYSITASAQSSLDDSGQAGVRIIFRRQRNGDVVAVETTDGDGMYTNPNTTGTYYVSAEKEGWLFSPEVIQVDSEHPTANFFGAPLAQTFDVSGIVLDTNGQRAPAVVIVAELVENRSISMHAMTNENGEWYFTGLAGEWEFIPLNDGRFDSFQPSSHLADSARNNLDFQAIPSPAGPGAAEPYMVEGYVLDEDGYGIVGAMVAALVDALEPLAMTWSGPGGYFSLDGLEGEVFVYVSKPGYDSFDPMAIAVSRPASLVFMGFQEDYDVSGSVTDVEGDPIPNVVITFTKDGKQVATAVTGPDGSFTYSGLKGEYEVTAQRAGWLFHPDPMTVTGSNSEVNFFGTPVLETYSASGRIHDTWGYGIEAVTVVLTLHDMGGVTLVTTTNGNGEWSFSGLRGKVTVEPQGPHSFNPAVQQIEGPMTNLNFTAF